MINKCFFCNKIIYTPFHITDIDKNREINSYVVCRECGSEYLEDIHEPKMKNQKSFKKDLSHIKTPEELLKFLSDAQRAANPLPPCLGCGLSEEEFDKVGRFGCRECYDHFESKMDSLVYPFHDARKHTGKRPKRQMRELWMSTDEEKLKLLKLQYAKALELEEYEKLDVLQKEIDEVNQSLSLTSEDQ